MEIQLINQSPLSQIPCHVGNQTGVAIAEIRLNTGNTRHHKLDTLILVEFPQFRYNESGECDRRWLPYDQVKFDISANPEGCDTMQGVPTS